MEQEITGLGTSGGVQPISPSYFAGDTIKTFEQLDVLAVLDTPHARPRAVLDFTKTYGTFLSSHTKGLIKSKVCRVHELLFGALLNEPQKQT